MGKFCLYSDTHAKAPCFAIQMYKYSYLKDFLEDNKRLRERAYSVPMQIECLKYENNKYSIIEPKCINCMFCVFGCIGNRILIKDLHPKEMCVDITSEQVEELSNELLPQLFHGVFLQLPQVMFSTLRVQYKSFEAFTCKKETENIAVWGANAMKFLSSSFEPRVSLEVGLIISERDRGGRLDISLLNTRDKYLFIAETKISFESMMVEQRYESQMLAYESEMKNVCPNNINRCKFLLIGGKESDLLPPDNKTCSGGNNSRLFYDVLKKHKLFFISANAILSLGLMKLFVSQDNYSLENLYSIIVNPRYVGLLSCGVVESDGTIISLEDITGFLK
jgi:NAD-dependent dihydropyrimidine dehydrogenase PreA subunit